MVTSNVCTIKVDLTLHGHSAQYYWYGPLILPYEVKSKGRNKHGFTGTGNALGNFNINCKQKRHWACFGKGTWDPLILGKISIVFWAKEIFKEFEWKIFLTAVFATNCMVLKIQFSFVNKHFLGLRTSCLIGSRSVYHVSSGKLTALSSQKLFNVLVGSF
jgi:hypothetical protein